MTLKKINLITTNHKRTKRNYLKRMMNSKVQSMIASKDMIIIIGTDLKIWLWRLSL